MARIQGKDIYLKIDDQIYFGDLPDAALWYDGVDLRLNHTISGTAATEGHHLIRKDQVPFNFVELEDTPTTYTGSGNYVVSVKQDELGLQFTSPSGLAGLLEHGLLLGLGDDDHTHYILIDGTRELTGDWTTGSGLLVPWLNFDTTATAPSQQGRLQWNIEDGALEYGLPGGDVILQIGQEQLLLAFNNTDSTITNGSLVYITGAQGDKPTIGLAIANGSGQDTIGMATEDIEPSSLGYVTTEGLVRDLNTGSYPAGSTIYLSSTVSGGFTNIPAIAPNYKVHIGHVVRQHPAAGIVYVHPIATPKMMELSDVFTETPSDGEVLIWNSTTMRFELGNTASGIDHGSLSGLEDDDHLMYVPRDGSRGFTGTVSGINPTETYHLTTKEYVDNIYFTDLLDTPPTYSGYGHKYVRVTEDETELYFEDAIVGVTSTGTTPPENSNLWYNATENEFYYYDSSRNEWLSMTVHNYLYTRQGLTDGLYMSVGDLRYDGAHYLIPKNAIITGITSSAEEVFEPAKGFEIQDGIGTVLFSFNHNNWTYVNYSADITLTSGTELRTFCVAAGNSVKNPAIMLEVRWRYVT